MNKWMVAITVMLPMLIVIVDTTVVNVSLDHIRGSLSAVIEDRPGSSPLFLHPPRSSFPMSGWVSELSGENGFFLFFDRPVHL